MAPSDHPNPADVSAAFATWAAVSVRLAGLEPEAAAAARRALQLDPAWDVLDAEWSKELCEDIANGRSERLDQYSELLAGELARRRADRGWTLERYARFCAELQLWPADSARIHQAHGLEHGEARQRVLGYWQDQLARDAQLRERWQALVSSSVAALSHEADPRQRGR